MDDAREIFREMKVASDPKALLAVLKSPACRFINGVDIPTSRVLVASLFEDISRGADFCRVDGRRCIAQALRI